MAIARKRTGEDRARRRRDRRRRDERRHGVRGAEQRRHRGRGPARRPQRQRDVDLGAGRARSTATSRACSSSRFYNTVRRGGKEVLSKLPPVKELAKRWEEHMKGMVLPGTLFEEFGFNYIGPIDGHDLDVLTRTLANVRALHGPAAPARDHAQRLRLRARRGRSDPLPRRHAVRSGRRHRAESRREAGVHADLRRLAVRHGRARRRASSRITPAMREGSGLVRFSQEFPERYFDVGIAEQHAVTFAAGLACEGMKPVVAIYSTFLQRGLRSAHPRRRAAEPAGGVRDRSRRDRRRRRRDAHRRLRPLPTCAASRT